MEEQFLLDDLINLYEWRKLFPEPGTCKYVEIMTNPIKI